MKFKDIVNEKIVGYGNSYFAFRQDAESELEIQQHEFPNQRFILQPNDGKDKSKPKSKLPFMIKAIED